MGKGWMDEWRKKKQEVVMMDWSVGMKLDGGLEEWREEATT